MDSLLCGCVISKLEWTAIEQNISVTVWQYINTTLLAHQQHCSRRARIFLRNIGPVEWTTEIIHGNHITDKHMIQRVVYVHTAMQTNGLILADARKDETG